MVEAIGSYCRETGQPPPATPGEVARCILESLALEYRRSIEQLARLLRRSFKVIHVVGGGSQNPLLCQFTANATGLLVLAGPMEATVMGNLLVQACATGELDTAQDVREVVRRSSSPVAYEPAHRALWDRRYEAYCRLLELPENRST
jgi:rhamnulokinase